MCGWSTENRPKKTPFWFRVEQWGHGTSHLVTSNQEPSIGAIFLLSSQRCTENCRPFVLVRDIVTKEANQKTYHYKNTTFFDDERPTTTSFICMTILSITVLRPEANSEGKNWRVVQYTRTVTDRGTMLLVRRVLYGPWNSSTECREGLTDRTVCTDRELRIRSV